MYKSICFHISSVALRQRAFSLLSDEGPKFQMLHLIQIGSTPTFAYFDLYVYSTDLKNRTGSSNPFFVMSQF